jgi:hypothetical protein
VAPLCFCPPTLCLLDITCLRSRISISTSWSHSTHSRFCLRILISENLTFEKGAQKHFRKSFSNIKLFQTKLRDFYRDIVTITRDFPENQIMNLSDYRLIISDIRDSFPDSGTVESTFRRFEALQRFLENQNPEELPTSLQLQITASPHFNQDHPYCENDDFEVLGGWKSFFVQSKVLEVFTTHNCNKCRSASIHGCLICLTWVAFTGYSLEIANQAIQMSSSRFNGYQNAVEGFASKHGVTMNFQSANQEPIGCSVNT